MVTMRKPKPIAAHIVELAKSGLHVAEIARQSGYSHRGVKLLLDRHNTIPGKAAGKKRGHSERAERMACMYRQGITLKKIGEHYGVTRERVRQILKKMGVTAIEGGQSKTALKKREQAQHRREVAAMHKWGISHADMKSRRADGTLDAFIHQRKSAFARGIAWGLTFPQWLEVWIESGKLELRGRGRGRYVMSRIKDEGGYVYGNVHIQLSTDNNSQGIRKCRNNKPAHTGVWCIYPGLPRSWVAKVGPITLGRFATEAEGAAARAAYLASNRVKGLRGTDSAAQLALAA